MKIQIALILSIIIHGTFASVINDHLRTFIEQERQNFPCGWPDTGPNGIPPLEPFAPSRNWQMDIANAGDLIRDLKSDLSNVVVHGLQQFFLHEVRLEVIGLWMRIDFSVDILNVNGMHDTTLFFNNAATAGRGRFQSVVRNFRMTGNFAMNTIQPGNFLNIRAIQTLISFGSINVQMEGLDSTINSILNSHLPALINDPATQQRINDEVSEVMLPIMNSVFNTMTMPDLVQFMSNRATNPPPQRCFIRRGVKFNF
ncbi:hypothetical protein PVAND_005318 [Polypedilum vanderplanki]|uniref:Hemolymph juvenile hormone binding protein n=1 Tax=Polypedilum vanderplanki TaxID=319348 RepID=A0A9J6C076_POLVA|nr:hypothetical protein PVAND_005318 [Polypedilum vanderplanki]